MNKTNKRVNHFLLGGTLASIVGSVCCIGPFFLMATGLSAAWMSRLMVLDAYHPFFAVLALALFLSAGWKLFAPQLLVDASESSCETVATGMQQKITFLLLSAAALVLLTASYWMQLLV